MFCIFSWVYFDIALHVFLHAASCHSFFLSHQLCTAFFSSFVLTDHSASCIIVSLITASVDRRLFRRLWCLGGFGAVVFGTLLSLELEGSREGILYD